MNETTQKRQGNFLTRLVRKQIFIPLAALLLLIVFNLIADPSFFAITLKENSLGDLVLTGNLITILDNASELVILAIGMTLVTAASGGQDISVGSAIAIAGSVVLRVLCGTNSRPDTLQAPIIVAFLACCVVSMLFGAFNGTLVAVFKIQPMVATLILYTAGRSIAAWINNNELPMISDPSFAYYGNFLPGVAVPTPIFIAVICMILAWALLRFTNIGLYSQAVGINASAARLNGIHPQFVKFLTYVILGLCVAVAGFIKVSRFSTINYSVVAKDIEMDAILAVALGGNSYSANMLAINVKRTKFLAHLICGILAGIGGFVYFLHVGSGSPSHASGAEMNAIASSIIGGTMLTGGVGNIIGTLFGVLSLSTIKNIVSSLGLDEAWWTNITVAGMICLFLVIQSLVLSRKNKDS